MDDEKSIRELLLRRLKKPAKRLKRRNGDEAVAMYRRAKDSGRLYDASCWI
jgi:hypothetical protein